MLKSVGDSVLKSALIMTIIASASGAWCLSAMATAAQAAEQAAEENSATLEEVIVTARKRAENLQKIPESMSVFSNVQLERSNVVTMRNFVDMTPNMIIRETFRSNETFLTMRGIASAQGALPPVAVVIDGVQVGANEFINQDLLDIERIEVLRGPQGALYGQGAIAGAINIVTRAPTNELESYFKATYGNANSYRFAGSLSGPIVTDKLFARVSGYYKNTDGLIKNRFGKRISFDEEYSVRGRLLYQGERLTAAFRASHTNGDGSCCTLDRIRRDSNGNPIGVDNVTNPGASSNIIGTEDTTFNDVSLKLDYNYDGATFTSVTGYAFAKQAIYADLDYTSAPIQIQDVSWNNKVLNQEVRLTSSDDSRFRWILGGFFQHRREIFDVKVLGDQMAEPLPVLFAFINEIHSRQWAVFGQADYDLTDKFQLTAALRYDHDKQDFENLLVDGTFRDAAFHQLQPKLQLSYDWTENVMAYATWSKGFRTGGFDQNQAFKNEVATNYEIGVKTTLLNGRMTANASVFHIDYANQQLSFVVVDPTNAANTLRGVLNVPATDIDGLELEIAAHPTDDLDVSIGVGIANTSITSVDLTSPYASPSAVGKQSPLAPPFTYNSAITYTYPLSGAMKLLLNGSYRRRGGYYFDLNNTIKTGTKNFFGGKIALEGESWSVGVWGKNLTNSRAATRVAITGSDLRTPNQPRSYGVEVSFRF